MSKKDKKVKTKKPSIEPWVKEWCTEHAIDLAHYRGLVVTLHPQKGIVCIARNVENAIIQEQFLRRSIAHECYHIDVDQMLADIGRPGLRVIPRPDKPMDPHRQDAEAAVPEKSEPPPPLSSPIDPFDNDVIIDGAHEDRTGDVGSFNPSGEPPGWPMIPSGSFGSPDKQPPFMPRRSPVGGSVRLDGVSNPGARGTWGRGLRYD